jgi:hypothetical protein
MATRRWTVLAGAIAIGIAACSVRTAPSAPPGSIDEPQPSEPLPVLAEPLVGSVERDGIRVTVAIERSPMLAAAQTWADVEVRNVGAEDLLYADPCVLVGASGTVDGATWRFGRAWDGQAAALKSWAMDRLHLADERVHIAFAPDWVVDGGLAMEEVGCDAMLVVKRLAPGQAVTGRAMWNGLTFASYAPPPDGSIVLRGEFSFFWRASEGQNPPDGAHERRIPIEVAADIVGLADPPRVHPGEAIDIALADPGFGALLRRDPVTEGGWYLRYIIDDRAWHVARRPDVRPPDTIGVIDAFTGEYRATLFPD